MGLVLAPERLVAPFLAHGELVEVLPKHPPIPEQTPLFAVHSDQRFVPPKVTAFMDFLVNRYGKDDDRATQGASAVREGGQSSGRWGPSWARNRSAWVPGSCQAFRGDVDF